MFVTAVVENDYINIWILQGSGETHLRCGGKYYTQFYVKSLADFDSDKFWKSVNICQSYERT